MLCNVVELDQGRRKVAPAPALPADSETQGLVLAGWAPWSPRAPVLTFDRNRDGRLVARVRV